MYPYDVGLVPDVIKVRIDGRVVSERRTRRWSQPRLAPLMVSGHMLVTAPDRPTVASEDGATFSPRRSNGNVALLVNMAKNAGCRTRGVRPSSPVIYGARPQGLKH